MSIKVSLRCVPEGSAFNMPAFVQIVAWRRTGDKPLSEPIKAWFTDEYTWLGLDALMFFFCGMYYQQLIMSFYITCLYFTTLTQHIRTHNMCHMKLDSLAACTGRFNLHCAHDACIIDLELLTYTATLLPKLVSTITLYHCVSSSAVFDASL